MRLMLEGKNRRNKGFTKYICTTGLFFGKFQTNTTIRIDARALVFGIVVLQKGHTRIPSFAFSS